MSEFRKSLSSRKRSKGPQNGPPEEQLSGASGPVQDSPEAFAPEVLGQKLSEPEQRLRLFVERVTDYAIFMLDPEGRVVTWNEGAQRIKGYSAGQIIGQHMSRFYTPQDVERGLPKQLLKLAETEGRVENEGWRLRYDGSRFWADVVITAIRGESGTLLGFGKVTRDLTQRKQHEQALSELTGRLVEAQDRERRRISLALSDTTSPSFVSLVSKLYQIKKRIDGSAIQLVDDSIALAEALFREIRTVAYLLHPPSLESDGLLPTLRSYLEAFTKERAAIIEADLPVELHRLPQQVEVALYRLVQESLKGLLHSSGNVRAKVALVALPTHLSLEVADMGRGLSSEVLEEVKNGLGEFGVAFAGVRERTRLLGGAVEIRSNDMGSTVSATIPLTAAHVRAN